MNQTEQFRKIAEEHGVSLPAVEQLYDALRSTGGGMAQFSHPDLGGYGQWMRGGMIMVGDMFNHGLKAKVNALCLELSALAASSEDAPADRPDPNFVASRKNWWPSEFGSPSSTGGQNQLTYAYFPKATEWPSAMARPLPSSTPPATKSTASASSNKTTSKACTSPATAA